MKDDIGFVCINNAYWKPYNIDDIVIEFLNDLTINIKFEKKNDKFIEEILEVYINHPFTFNEFIEIYIDGTCFLKNLKNKSEEDVSEIVKIITKRVQHSIKIKYLNNEDGEESFYTNRDYVPYKITKYKPDNYYLNQYFKK